MHGVCKRMHARGYMYVCIYWAYAIWRAVVCLGAYRCCVCYRACDTGVWVRDGIHCVARRGILVYIGILLTATY